MSRTNKFQDNFFSKIKYRNSVAALINIRYVLNYYSNYDCYYCFNPYWDLSRVTLLEYLLYVLS